MNQNNELYHFGVPGMKWGHRKAMQIQARKERSQKRYEKIRQKDPNSKKAIKAKIQNNEIQKSKFGQTNKQIVVNNALKRAGSIGIQTATAVGLIASGAVVAAPALAAVSAIAVSAGSEVYRKRNKKMTEKKLIENHRK